MNMTLIKALEVVWLIAKNQGKLRLNNICKQLNMNKTTAFRHLQTLISQNLIVKDNGYYSLGLGLFELGSKVKIRSLTVELIHPILVELALETNETVNLAQIYNDSALYLDKAESKRSLQINANIGDKLPLYCTALGKSILSSIDRNMLDILISNIKMEKITKYTITDPVELNKHIDLVRKREYSIDMEEFEEHLVCIAVPLKVTRLGFIGGISISGPKTRLNDKRISFLLQKLKKTRNEILDALSRGYCQK